MPQKKQRIDNRFRHIPRITGGQKTLLDLGCGDGGFLSRAQDCGWDVTGIDIDAKAVHNAIQNGVNAIEGGIEIYEGQKNIFDAITLSHVIEHVCNPVELLKSCHTLLKPGGQLWLQTPNIDSFGHKLFHKNWRGLESPRHLVLFNRKSLTLALRKAGFSKIRNISYSDATIFMYKASFAMRQGESPYSSIKTPNAILLRAKMAGILNKLLSSRQEFLTVVATKDHLDQPCSMETKNQSHLKC
jgi:SAM-dependent methyltransferase